MKKKNTWAPFAGWVGAVAIAVALAFAVPQRDIALGKVPPLAAKSLDQRQLQLPQQLPAGRTLALITFRKDQRAEAQSWVDGLQLQQQSAIAWLRMPVIHDTGDTARRDATEQRLLERHTLDRSRVVPLFIDRQAFIRAVGLSGIEHASVLVLDRDGNVLAKAEGPFDQAKGQALRETVLAQND